MCAAVCATCPFFGATAFNMSLSKQFAKVMETALCAVEKELHH